MPGFLQDFLAQLKGIWGQLSAGQRAMFASVLLAVAVGMGVLVWYGTRPDWVAFRSDLSGEERSQAIRVLEKAGIRIKVEGETLMVDAADRPQAETALARNGLGPGDGGVEGVGPFAGVMMTRDMSRELLRRTRAREVEKSIRANRNVVWAKVLYNNPERSLFVRGTNTIKPSASIVVSLNHPSAFRTVARQAVEITTKALGIDRTMVTVNSTDGQTFSEGDMGGGEAATDLLALEMRHSSVLTAKAQMALERLYPAKTMVAVTVKYANEITAKREKIVPEEKVLKQKTTYKTSSKQGGTRAGGEPNVGSITGQSAAGSVSAPAGSETTESRTEETYESDIGLKETRPLGPEIESISVSLAIDESLAAQKDQIVKLVENAVGWKQGRDSPVVAAVTPFPAEEDEEAGGPGLLGMIKEYGSPLAQILSVLLVLLFLRSLLKKQRAGVPAAPTAADSGEVGDDEDPAKQIKRLRREIERTVAEDPGSVSRLLESWMRDKVEAS